ncbi:hypothetical protein AMEX_G11473 [Astyanax mexicanus]|uniref:CARD domain-containing protein n=1 Tax=Astyanax mexicanus TaxID=7994 RepID=A0A8T2LXM3_ASTMX|nr:hypothetical protein AMEX_G11473 [Astyanax mexicanus]
MPGSSVVGSGWFFRIFRFFQPNAEDNEKIPFCNSENHQIEDCAIFEKLYLVVIGCHYAGKNEVGNAILQEKVFTKWGIFLNSQVQNEREIHNKKITLIRVPGWNGDLHASVNKQQKIREEIVNSVMSKFNKGPHAVLLALDVDSTITDTTINTLENLLTKEVWDHTIVIFTHGEKLKHITIHDKIRANHLDNFMKRCGKRYYVLQKNTRGKQHADLIETIEYFIADKDASVQFCISDREDGKAEDLVEEKKSLVKRLKEKYDKLKEFRDKLSSSAAQDDSRQQLIDSKDAEIARLQAIIQKKDKQIDKLEAQNAELRETYHCVKCERKDKEIRLLQEEVSKWKNMKITHKNGAVTCVQRQSQPLSTNMQKLPTASHSGVKFVDDYRAQLIQRVVSVEPILDEMYQSLGREKYNTVRQAQTPQNQMRELYDILEGVGPKLKEEFFSCLLKFERLLVNDLDPNS